MVAALGRLYNLKVDGTSIDFTRNGMHYQIAAPTRSLVRAAPYLQTNMLLSQVSSITDVSESDLRELLIALKNEGLEPDPESKDVLSGEELYEVFRRRLPDYLLEAFSARYWDVMLSGRGSRGLYIGYLCELYHYTRNAARHMPLAVSACPPEWRSVKRLLTTHYLEEWNHFDFFSNALSAMGISRPEIEASEPLPSTLAMSNFMRQAARVSPLAYSICSAILEGTTESAGSYGEFFKKIATLYELPRGAIQPIFDHLALDGQYDHKSLFGEICGAIAPIRLEEVERTLSFGQQMVDHIYLWSAQILSFYERFPNGAVRRKFDISTD